jgi:enoyl-CoA hydratase
MFSSNGVSLDIVGAVAQITIDRPASRNALAIEVFDAIEESLQRIAKSAGDIRVLVFRSGNDKAFIAGADIKAFSVLQSSDLTSYVDRGQRLMTSIANFPGVVIAAIEGYALGGGLELALACDLIVASTSEQCKLGQPEIGLGLLPGFGGTQRLMQRIGYGRARSLILTGDIISAERAYSIGLVDYLWPQDEFNQRLIKFQGDMSEKPPVAIREIKRIFRESWSLDLSRGLTLEVEAFIKLFNTSDCKEGIAAFLSKRKADFKGV